MAKKHKKNKGGMAYGAGQGMNYGMGYGAQDASAWAAAQANPAQAMGADFQAGMAAGFGAPGAMGGAVPGASPATAANGFMQQLPAFLQTRNTEQFLIGALVGAAAAWVLSDEELRGKILKSAMKLYAGVAGGFEEMKEQMADLKAEAEAERHGEA